MALPTGRVFKIQNNDSLSDVRQKLFRWNFIFLVSGDSVAVTSKRGWATMSMVGIHTRILKSERGCAEGHRCARKVMRFRRCALLSRLRAEERRRVLSNYVKHQSATVLLHTSHVLNFLRELK